MFGKLNPAASPHGFTLVCFGISLALICLAVIGVIIYVHKNNKIMKETLKKQSHDEFDSFRSTIENMNRGLVDNVVDILRDHEVDKQSDSKPLSKMDEVKKNKEELLNTFTRLKKVIKEDLYSTMKITGASRTALYLFHNGTRSTQGISFVKVSCIGEKIVVGSGIKEQILSHANLPVNMLIICLKS